MKLERRAVAVLGVVALVAVPAAILRVLCIGHSCDRDRVAARKVPFCSLPSRTRTAIAAGYREGRSPDILAVTERRVRLTSPGDHPGRVPWPSIDPVMTEAPVLFWGARIPKGAVIEDMTLADVAPSLAGVLGFDIPHPEVRSGRAVVGATSGSRPRVAFEIVLRGEIDVGSDPVLSALAERGALGRADLGSLPHDPAALFTTIGTGGVPAEHGITGTMLRNEDARLARAWASRDLAPDDPSASRPPRSVIATLADDLDETLGQRPKIALVADTHQARGLVGGNWYVGNDRDELRVVPAGKVIPTLRRLLEDGVASDRIPDLVGVSLRVDAVEGATAALHLLRVIEDAIGSRFTAAIVVLPPEQPEVNIDAQEVARAVNEEIGEPVVAADTAGGFFLDQAALAASGISKDEVIEALRNVTDRRGANTGRLFADVFPGLAVAFARFC